MGLREKNGKWEYRFNVSGQRVTQLTDLVASEENRSAAERLAKRHRDSILKGEQPTKRPKPKPFNSAADEFVTHAELRYSEHPSTARRIKTSLVSAKLFFGARPASGIRVPDVERYKVHRLKTDEVRPITLRHDLNNLSLFFQWAVDMEIASANPVTRKSYKGLPSEAERMHILTPAEEALYFERAASIPSLRDVARIIILQGCRPEEVMGLAQSDWDGADHITIRHGKTKAAKRTLRLTAEARMILERRSREFAGGKWFFPSPKNKGKHLVSLRTSHEKITMPPVEDGKPDPVEITAVLYDFRHTWATRAAQSGMDLATLARILGHSSLRMVTKYVHIQQQHMDESMIRFEQSTLQRQAHSRPIDVPESSEITLNQCDREGKVN